MAQSQGMGTPPRELSERDLRALFQQSPGLYLVLGTDLTIRAATDAYLNATMTVWEQIAGRHLFDVFPDNPADPTATGVANLRTSLERVLHRRQPDTMAVQKYDVRRPDSADGGFEERYWSPVNTPILGADGEVQFIVHRVEDVTEFVRLKQQQQAHGAHTDVLRTRTAQLESEVFLRAQELQAAHRQLELAHADLERLYERATELEQLKTRLFANVSHELRTPLALILGPIDQLIAAEVIGEDERRSLETMRRNAHLLLMHVNDLLDVSKLEAGRMELDVRAADLAAIARRAAAYFEQLAVTQRVTVTLDVPPMLPADIDEQAIERVLMNLLSNAFKFTPAGGMVRLAVASMAGQAHITVEDTGPGVPAELAETVFERFRQVDADATRAVGGTGLGLAIAKDFVALHGGSIGVARSSLGGAAFTVELPLRQSAAVGKGPRPMAPETAAAIVQYARPQDDPRPELTEPPRGRARVLVVDDNADMRDFITSALRPRYRVRVAANGPDALAAALSQPPDVVLSDMMMPGMSGEELLREMRTHTELVAVPFVALTARADDALRIRLLEQGAQDYLVKPFAPAELRARIGNLVAVKRVRDVLRRALATQRDDIEDLATELALRKTEADAAVRVRDEFLAIAAHELRTPLATLHLQLQGMQRVFARLQADAPRDEALSRALSQSRRLAHLVAVLLDVTLLSSGRIPLEPDTLDLREVVDGAVEGLAEQAQFVGCAVSVTGGPVIGTWDRARLSQVVANLMTNAIRYGAGAPIHVDVALVGDTARLTVRDGGAGIAPEDLARIFERFERASSDRAHGGLGLGLYITRRIVEAHGGSVHAASTVGEGAVFTVDLPLAIPADKFGHVAFSTPPADNL